MRAERPLMQRFRAPRTLALLRSAEALMRGVERVLSPLSWRRSMPGSQHQNRRVQGESVPGSRVPPELLEELSEWSQEVEPYTRP